MADNKKTVLVVDDEPDVVTFISTVLQDNGYDTVTAADGVQALERVKERRPDLIDTSKLGQEEKRLVEQLNALYKAKSSLSKEPEK